MIHTFLIHFHFDYSYGVNIIVHTYCVRLVWIF